MLSQATLQALQELKSNVEAYFTEREAEVQDQAEFLRSVDVSISALSEGTAEEVFEDPRVITSYLGE